MERRKPQFLKEPSYLIFPLPYSLAGIGEGVVLTALAGNIKRSNVDAYVLGIFGDAKGHYLAVEDIHLIPETLILDLQRQDINRAAVNNYEKRGMDSQKDDFSVIEIDKAETDYAKLRLTLFERRLELFASLAKEESRVVKVRDPNGKILSDLSSDPFESSSKVTSVGLLIDYTDDWQDPRKGVRLELTRSESPSQSNVDPDFYVLDKSLSFYFPLSGHGTWALNYFTSDATVRRIGETDPAKIRDELLMNCNPLDLECLKTEQELVDMFIAQRTYGTARALGGDERLRAYPRQRYQGAHVVYYGTELRWNISEEVRPFNFGIWKDVATGIQAALFYERGSVAETKRELGDIWRSSYGVGFRLVSGSGFVYRADVARGREGTEVTVIFDYPW